MFHSGVRVASLLISPLPSPRRSRVARSNSLRRLFSGLVLMMFTSHSPAPTLLRSYTHAQTCWMGVVYIHLFVTCSCCCCCRLLLRSSSCGRRAGVAVRSQRQQTYTVVCVAYIIKATSALLRVTVSPCNRRPPSWGSPHRVDGVAFDSRAVHVGPLLIFATSSDKFSE